MCNGTDPSGPRPIIGGAIAILHPLYPLRRTCRDSARCSISSTSSSNSLSPSTHSTAYALHLQNLPAQGSAQGAAQGYTLATMSTIDPGAIAHPLAELGLKKCELESSRELEGLKRCRLIIQPTGDLTSSFSPTPGPAPLHIFNLSAGTLTPLSPESYDDTRLELKLRLQEELDLGVGEKGVIGRKVQLVEIMDDGHGEDGEVEWVRVVREGVVGWN